MKSVGYVGGEIEVDIILLLLTNGEYIYIY